MNVIDMSIDEFKKLIKEAVKEELEEILEAKRQTFEFETLQSLKEIEEGKLKTYDRVEDMLKDMKRDEV